MMENNLKTYLKRRDFLKNTAMALGAITIIPSYVACTRSNRVSPNDKVRMAFCGIGNRGAQIFREFEKTAMIDVVAFCDTDMGAPHTLNTLKSYPDVPRFQDFRKMFDQMATQIDAVCIGVPDFSHFPITILAMSLGIHVYVEKPLSRTFQESELLMAAANKYDVVTQMGNQGHSSGNYMQFKTWVEKGIIKDVTKITAFMNKKRRWHGWDTSFDHFPAAMPIPETLDWDTWLGTAQHHDYHINFVNGQWRCWYDFGMGALGDWGAHIIDTAHEFLDLGLPTSVEPTFIEGHNPLFFPQASTLQFNFPARNKMPPLTIDWYEGLDNRPPLPKGYFGTDELGKLIDPDVDQVDMNKLNPGKIIYGKDLTFKGGSHYSKLSIVSEEANMDMEGKLPEIPLCSSTHFVNFIRACRGQEETRSPFGVAGPLSQVFVLGVIAQRLQTRIEFDRETKQITNNQLANQLLVGAPPRKGWEEFYKL